jgi:hypothetical protein
MDGYGCYWTDSRLSHGGNTGSNPVGDANKSNSLNSRSSSIGPYGKIAAHPTVGIRTKTIFHALEGYQTNTTVPGETRTAVSRRASINDFVFRIVVGEQPVGEPVRACHPQIGRNRAFPLL